MQTEREPGLMNLMMMIDVMSSACGRSIDFSEAEFASLYKVFKLSTTVRFVFKQRS